MCATGKREEAEHEHPLVQPTGDGVAFIAWALGRESPLWPAMLTVE